MSGCKELILKLQFRLCSFVIYIIFFCQSYIINNYLSRMTFFFHLNQHFFRLGLNVFFSVICKLKFFPFTVLFIYCIIHSGSIKNEELSCLQLMIHCNKSQSQLMNPACLYKITAKLTNPF